MRIKKTQAPVHVNEPRICGHFAKMAKCPLADTWAGQQNALRACGIGEAFPWEICDVNLLMFEADVQSICMQSDMRKIDSELLCALLNEPDQVFLVQDARTTGVGSLWFLVMEDDEKEDVEAAYLLGWPVRMIVNALKIDGRSWRVTAVQAMTIFRDYGRSDGD